MAKESAGLLLYRAKAGAIEVFLVHPGGPFWENKDTGAWTIPKGAANPGEAPLDAAIREFAASGVTRMTSPPRNDAAAE